MNVQNNSDEAQYEPENTRERAKFEMNYALKDE